MRKKTRLRLNRKSVVFIASLTLVVVLVVPLVVARSIDRVDRLVTRFCFDELAETSQELATDLRNTVSADRTILSAIATVIAQSADDADLCAILSAYSLGNSYLSYLELLRPDGTMLDADGTVRDVSDHFDFLAEATAGEYVSHVSQSTLNPEEKVVRSAVPVVRDGQARYVLYGVVRLSELAEKFVTNIYDGRAYVFVVDGDTGDFLLDTWHKSPGNLYEMGSRKTLPGYTVEGLVANLQSGVGGDIGFVSKTTGTVLYMRYDPLGVNNWSVMVNIEEKYAMHEARQISTTLYRMAGSIGAVLLLYVACVTFCLFRAYRQVQRLGTTDQTTGLLNRNAYDKFVADSQRMAFDFIACAYVDVNGLHDVNNRFGHAVGDRMLRVVADELVARFPRECVYRVGGDEFIVFCATDDLSAFEEKMREAAEAIAAHDYHIAFGVVAYRDEVGVDRVIREADEKMLADKRAYYLAHDRRERS